MPQDPSDPSHIQCHITLSMSNGNIILNPDTGKMVNGELVINARKNKRVTFTTPNVLVVGGVTYTVTASSESGNTWTDWGTALGTLISPTTERQQESEHTVAGEIRIEVTDPSDNSTDFVQPATTIVFEDDLGDTLVVVKPGSPDGSSVETPADDDRLLSRIHIGTNDLDAATAFYDEVLATIGATRLVDHSGSVAYGRGTAELWLHRAVDGQPSEPGKGSRVALVATSREQIEAFFHAAVAAGGTSKEAPGVRVKYEEAYHGCSVYDLDGHELEAMYWDPSVS